MPLKSSNRNTKPGREIRLEGQAKKPRQQARGLKNEKHMKICRGDKTKAKQRISLTIQLEEINKKILVKEERLKDSEAGSSKTNKTGH